MILINKEDEGGEIRGAARRQIMAKKATEEKKECHHRQIVALISPK